MSFLYGETRPVILREPFRHRRRGSPDRGGTSLTVYPAAALVRYYRGERLVLINRDKTPLDADADLLLPAKIGEVFARIEKTLPGGV